MTLFCEDLMVRIKRFDPRGQGVSPSDDSNWRGLFRLIFATSKVLKSRPTRSISAVWGALQKRA